MLQTSPLFSFYVLIGWFSSRWPSLSSHTVTQLIKLIGDIVQFWYSACYNLQKKIFSLFALSLVEHGDHSHMEPSSSHLRERLTSKSYEKEVSFIHIQGLASSFTFSRCSYIYLTFS